MKHGFRTVWVLFSLTLILPATEPASAKLTPLAYNRPGLIVDLGVGLWSWPLPMDYNGDGRMDLVVVCFDKPRDGTWYFENSGEMDGSTALPIFKPARKIDASVQSPGISYATGKAVVTATASVVAEGDTLRYSGNVYPDFLNSRFGHPVNLAVPEQIHTAPGRVRQNQWQRVDFDGDGDLDVTLGIDFWGDYGIVSPTVSLWNTRGEWLNGPLRGYVYLLRNLGTDSRPVYAGGEKVKAGGRPVDTFGMPSPMWGDFRGTGKLDLICGEFLDGFTYFENIGSRKDPVYASGRAMVAAEDGQRLHMDSCMITPVAVDFNGDGHLDIVCGGEDGRVALIENTGRLLDGTPQFRAPRYFTQYADQLKIGSLVTPYGFDWNGDGREDILCGDAAGYIYFLKNLGGDPVAWGKPEKLTAGGEIIREQAGFNGSIQGPAEAKWGYTTLSAGDWDLDGLPDIVVNGIWGKIVWYRNEGTRTAPKLGPARAVQLAPGLNAPPPHWNWWKPADRELVTQWRTPPQIVDWNHDGLPDLVMLDHEGYLALFPRQKAADGSLDLGAGQRIFWGVDASSFDPNGRRRPDTGSGLLRLNALDAGRSGRRTFCFMDWDGDGETDLLVNSVPNVNFLRGLGRDTEGRFLFRDEGPVSTHLLAGHATRPTTIDLQNAGRRELLVGAEDGFIYLVERAGGNKLPATPISATRN